MRKPWSLPAALLLALAACAQASDDPGSRPSPTDPRVQGTIVAESDEGTTVVFQRLPDGDPVEVSLPESVEFAPLGVPVDGGVVTLAYGARGATLYRVEEAGEVRPLIPRINDAVSLSVHGEMAAVGDCGRQALLIVPIEGGDVREAGEACRGTLSPDGRRVAWIRDGVAWRAPLDGSSPPQRWFAIPEATGLADVIPPGRRDVFEMTWGEPGLAVVVGTEEITAVIVAPESGPLRVVDTLGATFMSFLQWQPGGRLLALANGRSGGEGFVRLLDPDDGSLRTIALHPRGFVSAAWSPAGDAIVALSGAGFFGTGPAGFRVFLNVDGGGQFAKIRGAGGFLYGWGP